MAFSIGSDLGKVSVFHTISSTDRHFEGLEGHFRPQNPCHKELPIPEVRTLRLPPKPCATFLSPQAFPLSFPQNARSQPLYSPSTCFHDHISAISLLHPPNPYRILEAFDSLFI